MKLLGCNDNNYKSNLQQCLKFSSSIIRRQPERINEKNKVASQPLAKKLAVWLESLLRP
jgi:hypothetical protein